MDIKEERVGRVAEKRFRVENQLSSNETENFIYVEEQYMWQQSKVAQHLPYSKKRKEKTFLLKQIERRQ